MGLLRAASRERGHRAAGWVHPIAIRSTALACGTGSGVRAAAERAHARAPTPQSRPNPITGPTGNPGLQHLVGEQLEEPEQKHSEERTGQYRPERLAPPPVGG